MKLDLELDTALLDRSALLWKPEASAVGQRVRDICPETPGDEPAAHGVALHDRHRMGWASGRPPSR